MLVSTRRRYVTQGLSFKPLKIFFSQVLHDAFWYFLNGVSFYMGGIYANAIALNKALIYALTNNLGDDIHQGQILPDAGYEIWPIGLGVVVDLLN